MRVLPLAALAVVALAGCAQTAPPLPASLPSAGAVTSGTATGSDAASSSAPTTRASSASAAPSYSYSLPTVAPKTLTTVKLPASFGGYTALTTPGTGEQQVVYAGADPKDVLNVVVTGLADAPTIASAYTGVSVVGPALCGAVSSNGTTVTSCALPLDKGALVVTGAGTQKADQVAASTGALWSALS